MVPGSRAVFDQNVTIVITQEGCSVNNRISIPYTSTHLWCNESSQENAFHSLSQFKHIVFNFGKIDADVPLEISGLYRRNIRHDLMCHGFDRSTILYQRRSTGRSSQGHGKNLVSDLLCRIGVINTKPIVEKLQIQTKLIRYRVLWFQIGVILS